MTFSRNKSRLPDFYGLEVQRRQEVLLETDAVQPEDIAAFSGDEGLNVENANHMIENVIGVYGLPIGIATNFANFFSTI